MVKEIKFVVPARREFVGLARLAVGGLANTLAFEAETIEDIKLSISEVCTNFIRLSGDEPDARLHFKFLAEPDNLTIDVGCPESSLDMEAFASGLVADPGKQDYGISIITALLDSVELISDGDNHSFLRLKKFAELPN